MYTCARIVLGTSNVLLFICGVLQLSFGIVGIADPDALADFIYWLPGVQSVADIINIPEVVVSCSTYMIVVGCFMMLFGFLGCAGTIYNNKWLLFFYWVLLSVLVIVEIILIIVAACNPSLVQTEVQSVMYTSLHRYFSPVTIDHKYVHLPDHVVAVAWVSMQFEVGCCGVTNYTDYQAFPWNNTISFPESDEITATVPPSCCKLSRDTSVPKDIDEFQNLKGCLVALNGAYNVRGCYFAVNEIFVQYSYVPIGICSGCIVVQGFAIAMAVMLWRAKDDKRGVV